MRVFRKGEKEVRNSQDSRTFQGRGHKEEQCGEFRTRRRKWKKRRKKRRKKKGVKYKKSKRTRWWSVVNVIMWNREEEEEEEEKKCRNKARYPKVRQGPGRWRCEQHTSHVPFSR